MLFNIISILTWNRYDSCFNTVTHIYHVFPGIINTQHPGQNILRKWGGDLSQYMEGMKCCRRMPMKEFIHYMPAISLQSCKFTKMNFFTHIFKDFTWHLSYYLLCFFQESFHERLFHVSIEWGLFFRWGGISFDGGGSFEKHCRQDGRPLMSPYYGKPCVSARGLSLQPNFQKFGA